MFKDWKLYVVREHTKGYWSLGIVKGHYSWSFEVGKFAFCIYKEDF